MIGLDDFNGLADDAARHALLACCSAQNWVRAVAGGRPYRSLDALLAASNAAVAGLDSGDLRQALTGHPRIGDRPASASAGWSSQEQAGVGGAGAGILQALAEGNARYEDRFGHIYLACATGRDATELLEFLRERLGNDRGTEWRVVASELAKINQIRLRKLIGVVPEARGMSTVPEARGMSTVPEARGMSTVPEARGMSTVPEARGMSTVPEARR